MIPYIRDIILGKTKPERASFLIWTCLGLIAFFSQKAEGASASLWMTGFQTFNVVMIFLLSLKYGEGGLIRRDIVSLIIAGFGLLLWYFTKNALFALLLVILVDAIGAYLTTYKAYYEPETETLITWIMASLSGFLGIVAVGQLNLTVMLYPAYIFLANSAIFIAILLERKRKIKHRN